MHKIRTIWHIGSIVLLGAVFRYVNLNWDSGNRIHPDEALIVNGALSINFFSQLFAGFHDYNGLSIYILKIVSLCIAYLTNVVWWSSTPEGVTLVGRFISASISTMSIVAIYLLGVRLWNKHVGLIAALIYATIPLNIQLAHFYTTESVLIFFFLLLIHSVISYVQSANTRTLLYMAIPSGLLLATKNTSYFFLILPISAMLISKPIRWNTIRSLCIWGCISSVLFFLASPYSFIDWRGYLERSMYLADVVSGKLLMDWTLQFQRTNGFFWIPAMAASFGPIALLGSIGILRVILHRRKYNHSESILAWWNIGFFLFLAYTYLKFTRYLAPLLPAYALFGAKFLTDIYPTRLGRTIAIACIGIQVLMGCMYISVYTTNHTSLQAADWINQHIPNNSIIMTEAWNDIIRFNQSTLSDKHIVQTSFNFYTLPDDRAKQERLNTLLSQAEYIILESPKVKNTITRQSFQYPYTSRWYNDLESGRLGFSRVMKFTSYPRIGPIVLQDDYVEETFTVFDHPTITIYKKSK